MNPENEPLKIIGNESNTVTEIEATGDTASTPQQNVSDEAGVWQKKDGTFENAGANRSTPEITANDGSLIETFDTALHNKPGVAEGTEPSGSDRADYYEARSQGGSDAEEELDALNDKP